MNNSDIKKAIDQLIISILEPSGKPDTRERSLAITKLEEASHWIAADEAKRVQPVLAE